MRALIISDLHLNFSDIEVAGSGYDVVLATGDFSPNHEEIVQFFQRRIPDHTPVFFVPGNHEYEGHVVEEVDDALRELFRESCPNVQLLQNEVAWHEGAKIMGTTLWSDFQLYEPALAREQVAHLAKRGICDFQSCRTRDGSRFSPWQAMELHAKARAFLEEELAKPHDGPTLVLTHFLPHKGSIHPRFAHDALNAYFCTHMEDLMGRADFWVHGHTHNSMDYDVHGTRVIANPRGYSKTFGLSENPDFSPGFTLEVSADTAPGMAPRLR